MSFFRKIQSVWKSRASSQRKPRARENRRPAAVEPLEVRTLLVAQFSEMPSAGFADAATSSVAWGDYDNDGDLDAFVSGYTNNNSCFSRIYRNDGNNTFTDLKAGLTDVWDSSAAWGDYDNDGDLDLVVTGQDYGIDGIATVYQNNGNSTFTDIAVSLPALSTGTAEWGDYDNDGDLDLLFAGVQTSYGVITKIYRNDNIAPSNIPAASASRTVVTTAGTSASAAARVFTSLAGSGQVAIEAITEGTAGNNLQVEFVIGLSSDPPTASLSGNVITVTLARPEAEYLNTADLIASAISAGAGGSVYASSNHASGIFVASSPTNLSGGTDAVAADKITFTAVAPGVVGNNLQVSITSGASNAVNVSGNAITITRSAGTTTAQLVNFLATDTSAGAVAARTLVIATGTGNRVINMNAAAGSLITGAEPWVKTRTFHEVTDTGLTAAGYGSATWADADNDGDLDILLTGVEGSPSFATITKLYQNHGNGTFTNVNASLPPSHSGAVAWGDYDNDGDLDLLMTGQGNSTPRFTRIYRNDGNFTFTDTTAGIVGVSASSVAWGDYDNDGDLDVLISGGASGSIITRVYRNNSNSTFTDINAGITGMARGSVAWGDADNDGDLDILLTGNPLNFASTKFYRNNSPTSNTAPTAPTNLTAVGAGNSITFNWTAPTDGQTPSTGLTYNLRIGTAPGGSEVFSTMANTSTGTSRVASAGPIQGTSFTLKNLIPGTHYYWSVQAIDTAFAGGAFAAEQSASIFTLPTIGGAVANQQVNDSARISPFTALTVRDSGDENLFSRMTILNGVYRGDFTSASTTGWTRTVVGNDILYHRYYNPAVNVATTLQTAIRAFEFQPRSNAIKPNTVEATAFNVYVTDGTDGTSNNTTTVISTSVNNAPTLTGASPSVAVNDDATVNPLSTLTVTDVDNQEMLARVTILNGAYRGDFTNAISAGWTRSTLGNDITYVRYFSPAPNIGTTVQNAFRALVFQPRNNAIVPGTTELTDFLVSVSDGVAPAIADSNTRVNTTSVNNAPTLSGAVANQAMNSNLPGPIFSTLTVNDPDMQPMLARVTIDNGANRGDFMPISTTGWTRSVLGSDIVYTRYFNPTANIGSTVQTAIRGLLFRAQSGIPVGKTETTGFSVFITDGSVTATTNTPSVITTGVAVRPATSPETTPPPILEADTTTMTLPRVRKTATNSLSALLKKAG